MISIQKPEKSLIPNLQKHKNKAIIDSRLHPQCHIVICSIKHCSIRYWWLRHSAILFCLKPSA